MPQKPLYLGNALSSFTKCFKSTELRLYSELCKYIKQDLIYCCLSSSSFHQNHEPEKILPLVGSDQPKVSQQIQPDLSSHEPTCTEVGGQTSDESKSGHEDGEFLSHSQKDVQTLQDLVELAREGLTLTQWNADIDHIQAAKQPSKFWQFPKPCPQSLQLHRARLWLY